MQPEHDVGHTHSPNEEMGVAELREHLAAEHGWNQNMIKAGRCQGEAGFQYMKHWHKDFHRTEPIFLRRRRGRSNHKMS